MYPIIQVPDEAPEQPEQLGTKWKFWYYWGDNKQRWLFKEGRPNTGENWAEKVCCELCALLCIPHGHYEFAVWKDHHGVVTPTFVPEDGRLILGNELLAKFVADYDGERRVRVHKHTLARVMAVIHGPTRFAVKVPLPHGVGTVIRPAPMDMPLGYAPPAEIMTVSGVFVGYLMLDALVGNQDRHDENWGLILTGNGSLALAPTFDHASSLGRNEQDAERSVRLTTRDQRRSVERYVERAKSALYRAVGENPLTTLAAFQDAARLVPEAGKYWLQQLAATSLADYRRIFDNVPATEISEPARDFALRMLEINRNRLLQSQG